MTHLIGYLFRGCSILVMSGNIRGICACTTTGGPRSPQKRKSASIIVPFILAVLSLLLSVSFFLSFIIIILEDRSALSKDNLWLQPQISSDYSGTRCQLRSLPILWHSVCHGSNSRPTFADSPISWIGVDRTTYSLGFPSLEP